jgi:hypothetical protein
MRPPPRAAVVLSAAALWTSALTAVPATAEVRSTRPFSGYAAGTAVYGGALRAAGLEPGLLEDGVALSAASVDSGGLDRAIADEMGQVVQPAAGGTKKSYARAVGAGAKLLTSTPLGLSLGSGLAEAVAPSATPSRAESGGLAGGLAESRWSTRSCVVGQPMSVAAADVSAIDLPLVKLGPLFRSRSLTYLDPNPEGGFTLVSETRQTFAPLRLLPGTSNEITVELLGEWLLRATANGRRGGAGIEYGPVDRRPDTPVLRLRGGGRAVQLTLQDVLGDAGLAVSAPPLLEVAVGERPRAIVGPGGRDGGRPAEIATDGTRAAAAVDVLRLTALAPLPLGGFRTLTLRLGHMEASAAVPLGGVPCPLPVSKAGTPALVQPGEPFTWTISIPSSPDDLDGLSCDLVNLRAVDTTRAAPGVRYMLRSASHDGVIEAPRITWGHLGRYRRGDPPILLTVQGQTADDSARGFLTDTVEVSADLANCTGGLAGPGFRSGRLLPLTMRGRFTLEGPVVSRKG